MYRQGVLHRQPGSGAVGRTVADSRELESGFESVATGRARAAVKLRPDQAVTSPTKPAVVGISPGVMVINTFGLLSS
jgi:hypothetical protein